MGNGPQDDLAELVRLEPRAERRAESPLDHRIHGLDLPPLTILALEPGEPLFHHAPPSPGPPPGGPAASAPDPGARARARRRTAGGRGSPAAAAARPSGRWCNGGRPSARSAPGGRGGRPGARPALGNPGERTP